MTPLVLRIEAVRAWIYRILTPLTLLLVGLGYSTENEIAVWSGLVLAVLNGALAIANSDTGSFGWEHVRALGYRILTPLSAIAIFYGMIDESTIALWVGLISAALGGGSAVASTSGAEIEPPPLFP